MPMTFDWEKTNALAKALGGRVELLQELIKLRKADLSYSQIQDIVKSGLAKDYFDLGDEIMTKYTATDGTEYDFPWRVVDFRDVTWEDGSVHPGMVLQSKYATVETVPYDSTERNIVPDTETEAEEGWYYFGKTGSRYTSLNLNVGELIPHGEYDLIYKNGVNITNTYVTGLSDWKNSSLRQWLNSDAEAGNWWTSTHLGDVISSKADVYNGFMHGLESDFVNSIKATRISTWTDIAFSNARKSDVTYTYDKFFIASFEELYAKIPDFQEPKDTKAFGYFVKFSGVSEPTIEPLTNRCFKSLDELTSCKFSTRSYTQTFSGYNFIVDTDGNMTNMLTVAMDLYVVPCCVIS